MTRATKRTIQPVLVLTFSIFASATALSEIRNPKIESFSLPRWNHSETFDLDDYSDSIVVLDFFAYWCAPCLQASKDIEENIDRYYETLGGNPNGLPIKVVSVNIEKSFPAKTQAFVHKTGARFVIDDSSGELLKKLGGKALPFFAVVKKKEQDDSWEILYRNSGYEGAHVFRSVIDSIGVSNEQVPTIASNNLKNRVASSTIPTPSREQREKQDFPTKTKSSSDTATSASSIAPASYPTNKEELPHATFSQSTISTTLSNRGSGYYSIDSEALRASDISLQRLTLRKNTDVGNWEWDHLIGLGRIDIDYEPFRAADIIGRSSRLIESSGSLQTTARYSPSSLLQYQYSGGGYFGYSDHRSLWIDEYYRQQFSGLDGYEYANPWGLNLSGGVQWNTESRFGRLGTTVTLQQDDVAPGYDRPLFQKLARGREQLHSGSILIEQESIVARNARVRNQVSLTRTTDRDLRYQYSGYLNFALSESWVLRTEVSTTFEKTELENESDFHSYSGGITLERDWNQQIFLSFTGRKYEDNGQIETSILVSAGPPPLETAHLGATLRWQAERNAYKLDLASYKTRFDEVDSPIRPFGNLYQDRDWLLASFSFNRSF